ncbi:hypothetical protein UPYG_G00114730 [Umbra pygmaea]|uniref:Uncharacterized protein n=1 Tax=Umbra pygmaea TaxID=75934 RepID=A0ABD0XT67_UMBPY
MRPRSRLLVKRGLLPTIREGYEELVQDINQANSRYLPPHGQAQLLSTHDYFLSICQLARPTFPQIEPDCDILAMRSLASLRPCLRLHRLRSSATPCQPLTAEFSHHPNLERDGSHSECSGSESVVDVSSAQTSGKVVPSFSDPLEYLYSHREALLTAGSQVRDSQGWSEDGRESTQRWLQSPMRTENFPHMTPLAPSQSISSCPEIIPVDPDGLGKPISDHRWPQALPSDGQKPDVSSSLSWRFQNDSYKVPAGGRGKCPRYLDKHTVVSSWIADCRSAWRQARIRACMLPAIAEM